MIFVSLTFKKVPDKTQCKNQGLEYIIWVYSSLYFGLMSCSTVFQKGRRKKDILRIIFHISPLCQKGSYKRSQCVFTEKN